LINIIIKTPLIENSTLKLFPNPVMGIATIQYNLKTTLDVRIEICNINGQTISVLSNSVRNAGEQKISLNVSQLRLGTGVYFCRLTASGKNGNYNTAVRFQVVK